jgi:hypothetical protein
VLRTQYGSNFLNIVNLGNSSGSNVATFNTSNFVISSNPTGAVTCSVTNQVGSLPFNLNDVAHFPPIASFPLTVTPYVPVTASFSAQIAVANANPAYTGATFNLVSGPTAIVTVSASSTPTGNASYSFTLNCVGSGSNRVTAYGFVAYSNSSSGNQLNNQTSSIVFNIPTATIGTIGDIVTCTSQFSGNVGTGASNSPQIVFAVGQAASFAMTPDPSLFFDPVSTNEVFRIQPVLGSGFFYTASFSYVCSQGTFSQASRTVVIDTSSGMSNYLYLFSGFGAGTVTCVVTPAIQSDAFWYGATTFSFAFSYFTPTAIMPTLSIPSLLTYTTARTVNPSVLSVSGSLSINATTDGGAYISLSSGNSPYVVSSSLSIAPGASGSFSYNAAYRGNYGLIQNGTISFTPRSYYTLATAQSNAFLAGTAQFWYDFNAFTVSLGNLNYLSAPTTLTISTSTPFPLTGVNVYQYFNPNTESSNLASTTISFNRGGSYTYVSTSYLATQVNFPAFTNQTGGSWQTGKTSALYFGNNVTDISFNYVPPAVATQNINSDLVTIPVFGGAIIAVTVPLVNTPAPTPANAAGAHAGVLSVFSILIVALVALWASVRL